MGCVGWLGVDRPGLLLDVDHPGQLPGVDRPDLLDAVDVVRHRTVHHALGVVHRRDVRLGRHPLGADRDLRRYAYPAAKRKGCYLGVGHPDEDRAGHRLGVEPGHHPSAFPAGKQTGYYLGVGQQQLALEQAWDLASGHPGLEPPEAEPLGPLPLESELGQQPVPEVQLVQQELPEQASEQP